MKVFWNNALWFRSFSVGDVYVIQRWWMVDDDEFVDDGWWRIHGRMVDGGWWMVDGE